MPGLRAPAVEVAARLKAAFPETDFYLDAGAMREAIIARSMFNLLDPGRRTRSS